jgi:hypothetical protein
MLYIVSILIIGLSMNQCSKSPPNSAKSYNYFTPKNNSDLSPPKHDTINKDRVRSNPSSKTMASKPIDLKNGSMTADLEWLWTDIILDIDIERLNKLLFNNDSKLDRKLLEAIDIDPDGVQKENWKNGHRTRLITIPKTFFNAKSYAISKDNYTVSKPGKMYVVDEVFHSDGLPYGSSWDSLTRRVLIAEGDMCRYRVSTEIRFIKNIMFKGFVKNRFRNQMRLKHETTRPTIQKYLLENKL